MYMSTLEKKTRVKNTEPSIIGQTFWRLGTDYLNKWKSPLEYSILPEPIRE